MITSLLIIVFQYMKQNESFQVFWHNLSFFYTYSYLGLFDLVLLCHGQNTLFFFLWVYVISCDTYMLSTTIWKYQYTWWILNSRFCAFMCHFFASKLDQLLLAAFSVHTASHTKVVCNWRTAQLHWSASNICETQGLKKSWKKHR